MPTRTRKHIEPLDPKLAKFWVFANQFSIDFLAKSPLTEIEKLTKKFLAAWEELSSESQDKIQCETNNPFYFALFGARIAWHMRPEGERSLLQWRELFQAAELSELATRFDHPQSPNPFLIFSRADISLILGLGLSKQQIEELDETTLTLVTESDPYNQACAHSMKIPAAKIKNPDKPRRIDILKLMAVEALQKNTTSQDHSFWSLRDPDLSYLRDEAENDPDLRTALENLGVMPTMETKTVKHLE